MNEFRPKVFLLRALIGVFVYQGVLVVVGYGACVQYTRERGKDALVSEVCPEITGRVENLFSVATALTDRDWETNTSTP